MDQRGSHVFPSWLSFILSNPLRKWLHSPSKVIDKLGVKPSDVVIDFGCGPGFYTIPFAKAARRVIAIDIQPEMLEKAAKYAEKNDVKVEFLQSDGRHIPLPDYSTDLIFLSGVFHELDYKQEVLKEFSRLLKESGRLAIKEKTKRSLSPGPPIVKISEIKNLMQSVGFKVSNEIEIGNDTMILGKSLPNEQS